MTEYQKQIVKNMSNEDLLDNYRYFVMKAHDELKFEYVEFMNALYEEIMNRMSK